jgi:SOS-response transcriptional repressor LexA
MSSVNDYSSKGRYIISLLSKRKNLWSPFLSVGQSMVAKKDWDKASQSFSQALLLVEDLMASDETNAHRLKGATLLCIASLALCQDNFSRAIEYFRRSERSFTDGREDYGRAVAFFALGVVYESREEWREVFHCYDRTRKVLLVLGSESDAIQLLKVVDDRYEAAMKQWRKSIGDDPDVPAGSTGIGTDEGTPLEFLPVFGYIPAGDPQPIPERVTGYVETDHLVIDNKPYIVSNSKYPRVRLDFSPEISYVVLHVHGESMNKAGIEDGDYVIIRTRPRSLPVQPQNGEIVAVALPPDEQECTLKRFRKQGRKISFEPESTNPDYQSYEYEALGEFDLRGRIVGTLAAVLKPKR